MAEKSAIEWTDATFNPWWGCAKVSPGCDNCYAERDASRYQPGRSLWGLDADRRTFGDAHWNEPRRWERRAIKEGRRLRVFCASMADVFDNRDSLLLERARLWSLIRETPHLDWLILTKRIGNARKMLPNDWGFGYPNVWLGASVVNQEEADRDIPKLLKTSAAVRFLSCEPLLGPISLTRLHSHCPVHDFDSGFCSSGCPDLYTVDWLIVGGESGPRSRPMEWSWARTLREQCETAGVSFFMKQMSQVLSPDFKDFARFPADLQVREWPASASMSKRQQK